MRERDELRAWQVQIAEPLGYLVRAFGVGGYDVAEPSVIVKAWRELERERDEARAEVERLQVACHAWAEDMREAARLCEQAGNEMPIDAVRRFVSSKTAIVDMLQDRLSEARAEVDRLTDERDELLVRVANQDAELRATREAYNGARTDVPALIARVRELEAEQPCAIDQLDATMARMELHTVTEERNAFARSHVILKAIHGALTDALPNTPIPALNSFDVVETVRGLAIALEATETMLVAFLDRAERVILDGQEWVERNRGTVNMTQRAKKSKTFETNDLTRAPMTLVDYGLSMWVCAVCDKCAVFNRQAGKPNGWRTDRCPECQKVDE
jgi:uncharacterized coiled-coil DUF342 family protein